MYLFILAVVALLVFASIAARSPSGRTNRYEIAAPQYPEPEDNRYGELLAAAIGEGLNAPPDASDVGALEWMRDLDAASGLSSTSEGGVNALTSPWEGEDPDADAVLLRNAEAIARAREALAHGCLQPRCSGDEGVGTFVHLAAFRQLGRLLLLQGRAFERRGMVDEAVAAYTDVLRLADVSTRNGDVMRAMCGAFMQLYVDGDLARCVHAHGVSDEALSRFGEYLAAWWRNRVTWAETLAVDWEVSQAEYRRILSTPGPGVLARLKHALQRPFCAAYVGRERRGLWHAIQSASEPTWQRGEPHRAVKAAMYAETALAGCVRADGRDARMLRLRLQVALEQHRRAQGALPQALGSLVPEYLPELPLDPFTGEPMRYELVESGYRLYSVAEVDGGEMHYLAAWPPVYECPPAQRPDSCRQPR